MKVDHSIKAVTFDFWNTLFVEVAPAIFETRAQMIASLYDEAHVFVPKNQIEHALKQAWAIHRSKWRQGVHFTSAEAANVLSQHIQVPTPITMLPSIAKSIEYMYPAEQLKECDDLTSILEKFRNVGIRIGIICDTGFTSGVVLSQRLAERNFRQFFHGTSFSDEVGAFKPSPIIFRHSLSYLKCRPSEVVHVGDLWHNDIFGGRQAGFRTIRYCAWNDDKPIGPDADFVSRSYDQIANWVLQNGQYTS